MITKYLTTIISHNPHDVGGRHAVDDEERSEGT